MKAKLGDWAENISVQIRNYRVLQDFPDWYIINLQVVPNIYWLIKGRQYFTFGTSLRKSLFTSFEIFTFPVPIRIRENASYFNRGFFGFNSVPLSVFHPIEEDIKTNNLYNVPKNRLGIIRLGIFLNMFRPSQLLLGKGFVVINEGGWGKDKRYSAICPKS